ncbi:hypothetical protein Gotri_022109 [Gossypium trilobum]|uniref:DUF4283 domain-containing protein n=1 Tax=Gossypium trilobum TaxID=34281 RepID=A0A7J9DEU0_9ROSI|nr:hypothetical protein [Gossypium trilobum]
MSHFSGSPHHHYGWWLTTIVHGEVSDRRRWQGACARGGEAARPTARSGIEAFENGDAILVSNGTGRLVKKVRRRSEEPLDPNDPVVNDRGMKVDSVGFQSISWKDKLLRGTTAKKVDAKKRDDFQLLKGDARAKIVDDQDYPKNMIVWIRLIGLPEGLYTKSLLKVIGSTIGLIVKIDQNTDNNSMGQFARLAAYIDLGNPFVSKVKIDGIIQCVEYESLPLVCFGCERVGHTFEILSENHEGIEDSGSSDLNDNGGNLDSGTVIAGINELAKEKIVTQIKSKGFKKESNMSKYKGVVIANRLPANSNILKPNNKQVCFTGLNDRFKNFGQRDRLNYGIIQGLNQEIQGVTTVEWGVIEENGVKDVTLEEVLSA